MGWACRKSGIAVARGQRLTGAATCARIAEHCAALLLLRCVADLVGGLAPSFGSTTSNGHKQPSRPPTQASALPNQHHLFSSFVPCSKPVLSQACDRRPTPCFAGEGRLLILLKRTHPRADQPNIRPSRLTRKPLSAPRASFLKQSGFLGTRLRPLSRLCSLTFTVLPRHSSSTSLQPNSYQSENRPTWLTRLAK